MLCNTAIGKFWDDVRVVEKAAAYLLWHKSIAETK